MSNHASSFSVQSRITPVYESWRPALILTYALGRGQTGVRSSVMSAAYFSSSRVVRIAYPPATAHMLGTWNSWTWPWAKLGQAATDGAKLPVGHQKLNKKRELLSLNLDRYNLSPFTKHLKTKPVKKIQSNLGHGCQGLEHNGCLVNLKNKAWRVFLPLDVAPLWCKYSPRPSQIEQGSLFY